MTEPRSRTHLRCHILASLMATLLFGSVAAAESADEGWEARYAKARALLVAGKEEDAAPVFEQLAKEAPTPEDERRAEELAEICRSKLRAKSGPSYLRSQGEMTLLYSTAFVYGLGSSAWVALLVEPKNMAAAVLPFAVITTASVGGVALADAYLPFRRGVPQSIASGAYLGLGEGIWLVGIQHSGAARRDDGSEWDGKRVATALWGGATLGAIGGGVIGALRQPTPGRVSFTLSTSLWGGLVGSFGAAALTQNDERRTEQAFTAGLVGYNVGLLGGLIFAPSVAPSIERVRFIDLGGIGGGLAGAGLYTLLASGHEKSQASLGAASVGAALGLGLTWWATSGMPSDPPKQSARPLTLLPSLVRTPNGWLATVSGQL
ncbi:MAG TPA: hypothetical protein VFK05_10690 [Polyangiaceae bacterium]|nr:hypothetical protein [Polyangiaceae bacterium]